MPVGFLKIDLRYQEGMVSGSSGKLLSGLTKVFKGGKHKVPFSQLGVGSLKAKEVPNALLLSKQ